ncbi:MAG: leucyl aminopeptidase [Kiloniellales bacterium]
MKIAFSQPTFPTSGSVVVGVAAERQLTPAAQEVDKRTKGALKRALAASRFTGKSKELLDLPGPAGIRADRVVLVGLGEPDKLDQLTMQAIGGTLVAHLNQAGVEEAACLFGLKGKAAKEDAAEQAAQVAYGARLRAYRFDRYRTKEEPEKKPSLRKLTFMVNGATRARRRFAILDKVVDGVCLTRDLVSEPPNVIYPESLANEAKDLAKLGVKVEVFDVKQLRKMRANALLAVGQGSAHESRLVVLRWTGATRSKRQPPIAFVGKGVTFDTGGISLKPAAGMEDMKWDMSGSGVVLGLMKALAGRKAKVDAVGVVGLVENMPSGAAQRPSDIVTSMSGQTIEVLNTDAEGRLVLADALWYCQHRFKPRLMIDLATLTGAIVVALGHEYAGLFSNDDELAKRLIAAGEATGEKVWRLPLHENFDKLIDCDAADMKNISSGRGAGSVTAAQFLQRFVNDRPWAHLDIAGVAWSKEDAPTVPKGATAFGVRLLDRLVADNYED